MQLRTSRQVLGKTNRRSVGPSTSLLSCSVKSGYTSIPTSKSCDLSSSQCLFQPKTYPFAAHDAHKTQKTVIRHSRSSLISDRNSRNISHHVSSTVPQRTRCHRLAADSKTIEDSSPHRLSIRQEKLAVPKRTWEGRYKNTMDHFKPSSDCSAFCSEPDRFSRKPSVGKSPEKPTGRLERIKLHESQLQRRKVNDLMMSDQKDQCRLKHLAQQKLGYLDAIAHLDPQSEKIRTTCLPGVQR
ncbi:hypothetical protein GEMRC1_002623 [Eukaryota sp. GEM-RC1]